MKHPAKRAVSLALTLTYFTTQIAFGNQAELSVWAERKQSAKPLQMAALPAAASLTQQLGAFRATAFSEASRPAARLNVRPRKFSQPLETALESLPLTHVTVQTVEDLGPGNAAPVILIQDVHMNPEAQSNIAAALGQLLRKKNAALIGVEGAFEKFDFSVFQAVQEKDVLKTVADEFLQKGELAAPSYAGLVASEPLPVIWGVDDRAQYDANVNAYLHSRALKEKIEADLDAERALLEKEKRRLFSPSLREFDDLKSAYNRGNAGLGPYVLKLTKFAEPSSLALERFVEAYRIERSLNFERVETERKLILEKLARVLTESEISLLMAESVAYKMGRLESGAYYKRFKDLCEKKAVSFAQTPAFCDYVSYVLLADGIKAGELFDALEAFEIKIAGRLAQTPEEKKLLNKTEALALRTKLIHFSLTPKDWEKYRSFNSQIPNSKSQTNVKTTKTPLFEFGNSDLAWDLEFGSSDLSPFENFYNAADNRSHKIIENLLSHPLKNQGARILIVGGFHTPLLTKALREREISHIVVSPKITKVDDAAGNAYLSVFAREKTPLEKLLSGEKLFLAPAIVNVTDGTLRFRLIKEVFSRLSWTARFKFIKGAAGKSRPEPTGRLLLPVWAWAGATVVFIFSFLIPSWKNARWKNSKRAALFVTQSFPFRSIFGPLLELTLFPGLFIVFYFKVGFAPALFFSLFFGIALHVFQIDVEEIPIEQALNRFLTSAFGVLQLIVLTILPFVLMGLIQRGEYWTFFDNVWNGIAWPIGFDNFYIGYGDHIAGGTMMAAAMAVPIVLVRHMFFNGPKTRVLTGAPPTPQTDQEILQRAFALAEPRFGFIPPLSPTAAFFVRFLKQEKIEIVFDYPEDLASTDTKTRDIHLNPGLRNASPEALLTILSHEAVHAYCLYRISRDGVYWDVFEYMARSIQARVSHEISHSMGLDVYFRSIEGGIFINSMLEFWKGERLFLRQLKREYTFMYQDMDPLSEIDDSPLSPEIKKSIVGLYQDLQFNEKAWKVRFFLELTIQLAAFTLLLVFATGAGHFFGYEKHMIFLYAGIVLFADVFLTLIDLGFVYLLKFKNWAISAREITQHNLQGMAHDNDFLRLDSFYRRYVKNVLYAALLTAIALPVLPNFNWAVVFAVFYSATIALPQVLRIAVPDGILRLENRAPRFSSAFLRFSIVIPVLETLVFQLWLFDHLQLGLAAAGLIFAFSHTIVAWSVRALDNDWDYFTAGQIAKDLLFDVPFRFFLFWAFTHPLISTWFQSFLANVAAAFALHFFYNGLVLALRASSNETIKAVGHFLPLASTAPPARGSDGEKRLELYKNIADAFERLNGLNLETAPADARKIKFDDVDLALNTQNSLRENFPTPKGGVAGRRFGLGIPHNQENVSLEIERTSAGFILTFSWRVERRRRGAPVTLTEHGKLIWENDAYVNLLQKQIDAIKTAYGKLEDDAPVGAIEDAGDVFELLDNDSALSSRFPRPNGQSNAEALAFGGVYGITRISLKIEKTAFGFILHFNYDTAGKKGVRTYVYAEKNKYVQAEEFEQTLLRRAYQDLEKMNPGDRVSIPLIFGLLHASHLQPRFIAPNGQETGRNLFIGFPINLESARLEIVKGIDGALRFLFYPRRLGQENYETQAIALEWDGSSFPNALSNERSGESTETIPQRLRRLMASSRPEDHDAAAPDYTEYLENLTPFWQHWAMNYLTLQFMLSRKNGKEILSAPALYLGSGPSIGHRTWRLLKNILIKLGINPFPKSVSMDRSRLMLEEDKKRYDREGVAENERPLYEVGDMQDLSRFKDKSFKRVENASVQTVLGKDKTRRAVDFTRVVGETNRVLEIGGMALFMTNGRRFGPAFVKNLERMGFDVVLVQDLKMNDELMKALQQKRRDGALTNDDVAAITEKFKGDGQFIIAFKREDTAPGDGHGLEWELERESEPEKPADEDEAGKTPETPAPPETHDLRDVVRGGKLPEVDVKAAGPEKQAVQIYEQVEAGEREAAHRFVTALNAFINGSVITNDQILKAAREADERLVPFAEQLLAGKPHFELQQDSLLVLYRMNEFLRPKGLMFLPRMKGNVFEFYVLEIANFYTVDGVLVIEGMLHIPVSYAVPFHTMVQESGTVLGVNLVAMESVILNTIAGILNNVLYSELPLLKQIFLTLLRDNFTTLLGNAKQADDFFALLQLSNAEREERFKQQFSYFAPMVALFRRLYADSQSALLLNRLAYRKERGDALLDQVTPGFLMSQTRLSGVMFMVQLLGGLKTPLGARFLHLLAVELNALPEEGGRTFDPVLLSKRVLGMFEADEVPEFRQAVVRVQKKMGSKIYVTIEDIEAAKAGKEKPVGPIIKISKTYKMPFPIKAVRNFTDPEERAAMREFLRQLDSFFQGGVADVFKLSEAAEKIDSRLVAGPLQRLVGYGLFTPSNETPDLLNQINSVLLSRGFFIHRQTIDGRLQFFILEIKGAYVAKGMVIIQVNAISSNRPSAKFDVVPVHNGTTLLINHTLIEHQLMGAIRVVFEPGPGQIGLPLKSALQRILKAEFIRAVGDQQKVSDLITLFGHPSLEAMSLEYANRKDYYEPVLNRIKEWESDAFLIYHLNTAAQTQEFGADKAGMQGVLSSLSEARLSGYGFVQAIYNYAANREPHIGILNKLSVELGLPSFDVVVLSEWVAEIMEQPNGSVQLSEHFRAIMKNEGLQIHAHRKEIEEGKQNAPDDVKPLSASILSPLYRLLFREGSLGFWVLTVLVSSLWETKLFHDWGLTKAPALIASFTGLDPISSLLIGLFFAVIVFSFAHTIVAWILGAEQPNGGRDFLIRAGLGLLFSAPFLLSLTLFPALATTALSIPYFGNVSIASILTFSLHAAYNAFALYVQRKAKEGSAWAIRLKNWAPPASFVPPAPDSPPPPMPKGWTFLIHGSNFLRVNWDETYKTLFTAPHLRLNKDLSVISERDALDNARRGGSTTKGYARYNRPAGMSDEEFARRNKPVVLKIFFFENYVNYLEFRKYLNSFPQPQRSEIEKLIKRYYYDNIQRGRHPVVPPGTNLIRLAHVVEDGVDVVYFVPENIKPIYDAWLKSPPLLQEETPAESVPPAPPAPVSVAVDPSAEALRLATAATTRVFKQAGLNREPRADEVQAIMQRAKETNGIVRVVAEEFANGLKESPSSINPAKIARTPFFASGRGAVAVRVYDLWEMLGDAEKEYVAKTISDLTLSVFNEGMSYQKTLDVFEQRDSGLDFLLLVDANGSILGFSRLLTSTSPKIDKLIVIPSARNKNYGRLLMDAAFRMAEKRHWDGLHWDATIQSRFFYHRYLTETNLAYMMIQTGTFMVNLALTKKLAEEGRLDELNRLQQKRFKLLEDRRRAINDRIKTLKGTFIYRMKTGVGFNSKTSDEPVVIKDDRIELAGFPDPNTDSILRSYLLTDPRHELLSEDKSTVLIPAVKTPAEFSFFVTGSILSPLYRRFFGENSWAFWTLTVGVSALWETKLFHDWGLTKAPVLIASFTGLDPISSLLIGLFFAVIVFSFAHTIVAWILGAEQPNGGRDFLIRAGLGLLFSAPFLLSLTLFPALATTALSIPYFGNVSIASILTFSLHAAYNAFALYVQRKAKEGSAWALRLKDWLPLASITTPLPAFLSGYAPLIPTPPDPEMKLSMVVPIYKELSSGNILYLLNSLANQENADPKSFEILLVINNTPEAAAAKNDGYVENQELLAVVDYINNKGKKSTLPESMKDDRYLEIIQRVIDKGLVLHAINKSTEGMNRNIGKIRNVGVTEALHRFRQAGRVGFVANMDGDAIVSKNYIHDLLALLKKPDLHAVYADEDFEFENISEEHFQQTLRFQLAIHTEMMFRGVLSKKPSLRITPQIVVRSDAFEELEGFKELQFGEDADLVQRIAEKYNAMFAPHIRVTVSDRIRKPDEGFISGQRKEYMQNAEDIWLSFFRKGPALRSNPPVFGHINSRLLQLEYEMRIAETTGGGDDVPVQDQLRAVRETLNAHGYTRPGELRYGGEFYFQETAASASFEANIRAFIQHFLADKFPNEKAEFEKRIAEAIDRDRDAVVKIVKNLREILEWYDPQVGDAHDALSSRIAHASEPTVRALADKEWFLNRFISVHERHLQPDLILADLAERFPDWLKPIDTAPNRLELLYLRQFDLFMQEMRHRPGPLKDYFDNLFDKKMPEYNAAGSILSPLYALFFSKDSWSYWILTALVSALWETKVFHDWGLTKAPQIISSFTGLDSMSALAIGVFFAVIVFSFAHTIVAWILKAEQPDWKRDFLIRAGLGLIFSLPVLLSLSVFPALASSAFTVPYFGNVSIAFLISSGGHASYNAFALWVRAKANEGSAWAKKLQRWLPLASMFSTIEVIDRDRLPGETQDAFLEREHFVDRFSRALEADFEVRSDEEILDFLNMISPRPLTKDDFTGVVRVGYKAEGAHKMVFQMNFEQKNKEHEFNILVALKRPKYANDISNAELEWLSLLSLESDHTPVFGFEVRLDDEEGTLHYFLEEFIEGRTARELKDAGELDHFKRALIVKAVLRVASLMGKMPKDIHGGNLVYENHSSGPRAVVVDIGDKTVALEESLLRIISFYGNFGEKIGSNRFIFQLYDEIFEGIFINGETVLEANLSLLKTQRRYAQRRDKTAGETSFRKQLKRDKRGEPALKQTDIDAIEKELEEYLLEQSEQKNFEPETAASLLSPIYALFFSKNSWPYWILTVLFSALWETKVFHDWGLTKAPQTIASFTGFDPISSLAIGVFFAVIVFSFAHTIVAWILKAEQPDWKRDFFIRAGLGLIFSLPVLLSLSVFPALASSAFTVPYFGNLSIAFLISFGVHASYNAFALWVRAKADKGAAWAKKLQPWLPLGSFTTLLGPDLEWKAQGKEVGALEHLFQIYESGVRNGTLTPDELLSLLDLNFRLEKRDPNRMVLSAGLLGYAHSLDLNGSMELLEAFFVRLNQNTPIRWDGAGKETWMLLRFSELIARLNRNIPDISFMLGGWFDRRLALAGALKTGDQEQAKLIRQSLEGEWGHNRWINDAFRNSGVHWRITSTDGHYFLERVPLSKDEQIPVKGAPLDRPFHYEKALREKDELISTYEHHDGAYAALLVRQPTGRPVVIVNVDPHTDFPAKGQRPERVNDANWAWHALQDGLADVYVQMVLPDPSEPFGKPVFHVYDKEGNHQKLLEEDVRKLFPGADVLFTIDADSFSLSPNSEGAHGGWEDGYHSDPEVDRNFDNLLGMITRFITDAHITPFKYIIAESPGYLHKEGVDDFSGFNGVWIEDDPSPRWNVVPGSPWFKKFDQRVRERLVLIPPTGDDGDFSRPPPGSLLDPFYRMFVGKNSWAYWLLTIFVSSFWETKVFHDWGLTKAPQIIASFTGMDPILSLAIGLFFAVAVFSFAHTILNWILKAEQPNWKLDLFIRAGLGLIFSLPVLLSLSILPVLATTAFTVPHFGSVSIAFLISFGLHASYNALALWVESKWLPLASMGSSRRSKNKIETIMDLVPAQKIIGEGKTVNRGGADPMAFERALRDEVRRLATAERMNDPAAQRRIADLLTILRTVLTDSDYENLIFDINDWLKVVQDANAPEDLIPLLDSNPAVARGQAMKWMRLLTKDGKWPAGKRIVFAAPSEAVEDALKDLRSARVLVRLRGSSAVELVQGLPVVKGRRNPTYRFLVSEGAALPARYFDLRSAPESLRRAIIVNLILEQLGGVVELRESHLPDWQKLRQALTAA